MKRIGLVCSAAVVLGLLFVLLSRKSPPAEIVRRSEAILSAKVHAYYQHPGATALAAVKDAIANHRKAIERAELPPEAREAVESSLSEQIFIVRGIAHNADLEL